MAVLALVAQNYDVRNSHACFDASVQPREITQRQLRNASGEIMLALDAGESFVLTRNGVAVGELTPIRRRRFVARAEVLAGFANAARIDYQRFRRDLDAVAGQITAGPG